MTAKSEGGETCEREQVKDVMGIRPKGAFDPVSWWKAIRFSEEMMCSDEHLRKLPRQSGGDTGRRLRLKISFLLRGSFVATVFSSMCPSLELLLLVPLLSL